MPHSIASISEKSLIVQGKRVPSAYPEPRRKNGVAERSMTRVMPILRLNGLQAGDPKAGRFLVLLSFLLFLPGNILFDWIAGLLAIAVVGLVVEYQDVLQAHQVRHDPLDHLAFGFFSVISGSPRPWRRDRPPLEMSSRSRNLNAW